MPPPLPILAMLYLETRRIDPKDIIAVLPIRESDGTKSAVLLADGQLIHTGIAPATLKKRLDDCLPISTKQR